MDSEFILNTAQETYDFKNLQNSTTYLLHSHTRTLAHTQYCCISPYGIKSSLLVMHWLQALHSLPCAQLPLGSPNMPPAFSRLLNQYHTSSPALPPLPTIFTFPRAG